MENSNENKYVQAWKMGANAIKGAYELFEKDASQRIKELAEQQKELILTSCPNKELNPYEQMNEEQKQFIDYLNKVIKTGEL